MELEVGAWGTMNVEGQGSSKGTEPETPAGGETDPGVPWTRSRAEGI